MPCNNEYFSVNTKNKSDGLYPNCKRCNSKKFTKWTKDNREWHNENNRKARAENRWNIVELMRENSKRRRESGQWLEWTQTEAGKISCGKSNYKRSRKKHKINDSEWLACKKYFNNCCAYCGKPISENWVTRAGKTKLFDFDREHVDDEGANDLSNCIPSCRNCNSQKWEFDFMEWYSPNNPVFNDERFNKILQWLSEDYKKYIKI